MIKRLLVKRHLRKNKHRKITVRQHRRRYLVKRARSDVDDELSLMKKYNANIVEPDQSLVLIEPEPVKIPVTNYL